MMRSYITFTRQNVRLLSFGVILMILSSPGQTFFISLFAEDIRRRFAVSDGEIGMIFALATFASALALPYIGQQIDRMALRTFTFGVGLLLSAACMMLGLVPSSVLLFGLCIFLLRLGGQGLMVHTAMTGTVRAFPADSGKAIAVVSLFYSAALSFIPALTVLAISFLGWRWTWCVTAFVVIAGAVAAARLLPDKSRSSGHRLAEDVLGATRRPKLRMMLLACPIMLAISFIFTGLLFHQAVLANEKGWSLDWMATCFSAFAIAQAVTSAIAGPAIDRLRAVRILPVFLLPLVAALCLVTLFDNAWIPPVYMGLVGVSAAIDLKLGTILWSDLFDASHLGYVRSRFEAIRIIVTGAAPFIVGALLDMGIPLTLQAAAFACYALCVSGLAVLFSRFAAGTDDRPISEHLAD